MAAFGGECSGTLLYVMGPSGSGKDSLINHAREALGGSSHGGRRIRFARRYITRPADSGGEVHYPVSHDGFAALKRVGEFCMSWQGHGLHYGIGHEVSEWLDKGDLVVVNGSRAYLPEAERLFKCLVPALVNVRIDVLRQRLESRGREKAPEIAERLAMAALPLETRRDVLKIDNSDFLEDAQREFRLILSYLLACGAWEQYRPGKIRAFL